MVGAFRSASGHLQTSPAGQARSALPLEADIGGPICHVGYGPLGDMAARNLADGGVREPSMIRVVGPVGADIEREHAVRRRQPVAITQSETSADRGARLLSST